jgi:two-component system phosphate regulon sensor histidine kinase PhoR
MTFSWSEILTLPPFWVILLSALILGGIVVNRLWISRERRILKSLTQIIQAEKQEKGEEIKLEADDVEAALKALFLSRKQEMEHLKRLENYRRDYIGNVAHELKTPIFSIQGYMDSISDDPEMDSDTMQLFLEKAQRNTERLVQIVNDLDTITKYESGFLRLDYDDFNIQELAAEVIESLEIQAGERKINLYEYAATGNMMVHADKFRIRQVLTNLVYNSIKYGKEGGYTKIRLSDTGSKIIVEVADNGIGIAEENLGRIFERFFRGEKSRSRDSGGSGLGLSICKHIVEAHGEQISVISTMGAGSVFTFALKKSVIAE